MASRLVIGGILALVFYGVTLYVAHRVGLVRYVLTHTWPGMVFSTLAIALAVHHLTQGHMVALDIFLIVFYVPVLAGLIYLAATGGIRRR